MCLYSQRQGISRPQNQRPLLHRFHARQLSPSQAKQQRRNFRKSVHRSLELLLHPVFLLSAQLQVVVSFLFCSPRLAVALSVYLSLSHSPLRLLWGVKKEPTGDLCSIMQVCSCAVCCRLFAPHIAFLPVETHTHNLWHTHTQPHMHRGKWTLAASAYLVPGVRLRGA